MKLEYVPFHILQEFTDDFSEERKVGDGAFGVVYRGVTRNGDDVAVKKLLNINLDYRQFQNEIYNLWKLKHRNTVQILGYCYETEQKPFINLDGSMVLVEETHRAICLEYLHNGSLQKHISDEFHGLDWHMRFKIIKGACEGLKYIHEELEESIYHLDLKPDNILLDKDMVPKIADFGLSKIFGKELTRTTKNPYGTRGYQPPEYIDRGEISAEFDIFSLGVVMIRVVFGHEGYYKCFNMSSDESIDQVKNDEYIDQVQKNWRNRLQASCHDDSLLERYCHQVETCTQIALKSVEKERQKRPNILEITEMLNQIETGIRKLPQEGCHKTVSRMTIHNKKIQMTGPHDTTGPRQHINLMTGPSCGELEFIDAREISSDVVEELIVGRTEEKGELMVSLLEGISKRIVILPIYGIGGIGKTTFARLIYNDPEFKYYSHVWVHVSQRFDLNKIRESVISHLSRKEEQASQRHMMHSRLAELLSGKKIMIVLDDLWEDDPLQLEELKDMLYHDHSSIIILVTTRSEHVAQRICTNLQPYKILPLTNDMCWDIIKQRSGFEGRGDKEQLMDVGQEIAQKCGGVALAALSLGFTLRSMNFYQWVKVKDSDVWNELVSKDFSDHVLASLRLSYSSMSPCLKACFAYCATFPKGYKIVKSDLIYQWISFDFIKPTKLLSSMQLCEKYIVQLMGLSFFQPVAHKIFGPYDEDVTMVTMHDLVHDLAESVIVDEILEAPKPGYGGGRICCELLEQYPTKIRALRYLESDKTVRHGASSVFGTIGLHDDIFSASKYLRVLDLSGCFIPELPDSIGNLKQLRYFNAPRVQDRVIPNCITKLSKLIYLNLCWSSTIFELPESIGEMEGLMYLDLSGCSALKKLPLSFAKLTKLVHLDLSNCFFVRGVPESLKIFSNLEYLKLSGFLGAWPISFGTLKNLVYLDLSRCYDISAKTLVCLTKLQHLNLSNLKCSCSNGKLHLARMSEAMGNLTKLRRLNLSNFLSCASGKSFCIVLECISNLQNLEHLDLSVNPGITSVPDCFRSLRKLRTLDLSLCWRLSSLPAFVTEMDSIRFLNLEGCNDMLQTREQPAGYSKILLTLPHFAVQARCRDSRSNLVLLQDVNPTYLVVSKLENVKSVQETRNIELSKKQGMKILELEWTEDAEMFVEDADVLEELVPPNTLEDLWIRGYHSLRLPEWFAGISSHLPNLVRITMSDLPKCNRLPPFGQLPNLQSLVLRRMNGISKIDGDLRGTGKQSFPKLRYFSLEEMESLQVWYTTHSDGGDGVIEFMFPNLRELRTYDCPNLRLEPCVHRAKRWKIRGDGVISWGASTCITYHTSPSSLFAPVTALHVEGCKVPMHQWRLLHHLPFLVELTIEECSDMRSSPEIMRALCSLQLLTLIHEDHRELPNWLGNLTSLKELTIQGYESKALQDFNEHLTLLKSLRLVYIQSMTVLPQWVGNLISLQLLEISWCKYVNVLPGSIGRLNSLKELAISHCNGITSLPEGIQQLTRLEKLTLFGCDKLKKWCKAEENKGKLAHIKQKEFFPL